jgi:hypothetical protein
MIKRSRRETRYELSADSNDPGDGAADVSVTGTPQGGFGELPGSYRQSAELTRLAAPAQLSFRTERRPSPAPAIRGHDDISRARRR